MLDRYLDNVLLGGSKGDVQAGTAKGHTSVLNVLGSCVNVETILNGSDLVSLRSIVYLVASLIEPEAVCEFHVHFLLEKLYVQIIFITLTLTRISKSLFYVNDYIV